MQSDKHKLYSALLACTKAMQPSLENNDLDLLESLLLEREQLLQTISNSSDILQQLDEGQQILQETISLNDKLILQVITERDDKVAKIRQIQTERKAAASYG